MSLSMMVVIILFFVFLFLGFPVLFSLGLPCIFWLFMNPRMPDTIIAQNMMSYMTSFTLICLPGFLFVGRLMNSCGVTDRLFKLSIATVGRFRGGMAHANAFCSALFASMSGSAIADAGGLGLVEMRMMKRAGYKLEFAAGITAASSVLGPIIPPSAAMVLIGTVAEISVASMFFGGFVPGVILCSALMVQIAIRSVVTKEGRSWPSTKVPLRGVIKSVLESIPALMTFVIIMGSIWAGICTPTEAAVVAALYSIFLGVVYKKLTIKLLWQTLKQTTAACGPLLIIMTSASVFTWVLMREGLPQMITAWMQNVAALNGNTIVLLSCLVIFLIIGCFIDSTCAVLLCAPIVFPVIKSIGIDPVQFGVVMTLALIIGVITPPFGICLFVVSGVAKVPVKDVTKEAVKYLPAMIIVLLLITFFPDIVLFLPKTLLGYVPR
ncbi:MAG: TRAP transporter large permease [Treponema sp.]|jgi:tripartite ATP-independent transporter DctM subunit|nr:TRAP transporter large permease [Treponema sp.]